MKAKYLSVLVSLLFVALIGSCTSEDSSAKRTIIATKNAPAAIGPYSQAVLVGNALYCSGQIPINPKTGEVVEGDIQTQTRQVLSNLEAVLTAAGMDFQDVVKVTVFMRDMEDYGKINQVYSEYFSKNPPARAAVQVARLPKDVGVEISLIAVKTDKQ